MRIAKVHNQQLGFFVPMLLVFTFGCIQVKAQTTAGNATFSFLQLPYSAKATSLGGVNISTTHDLGLAMYNPALLHSEMDGELQASVKPYYAAIQQYDVSGAHFWSKKNMVIGWGVHYMDYGNMQMTDVIGNELGTFTPRDYALQVSMATKYMEWFQIGTTLKWIHSNYGLYQSSGVALDLGLLYTAPSELSHASILIKNMGAQTKSYGLKEELPFNVLVGWTKKLQAAPIQFSITAERLSVWNNLYYDSSFSNEEGLAAPASLQNVFNHFILGGTVFIGDQVDLNIGYNFIRRFDLNMGNQQNFMNGLSAGFGLALNRTKIQYGNAYFQRNLYHHFTISYNLKR